MSRSAFDEELNRHDQRDLDHEEFQDAMNREQRKRLLIAAAHALGTVGLIGTALYALLEVIGS